jgi:16S rRNA (cytidine1402-2'-O)-methyltransferase
MAEVFGPGRKAAACRELTKTHEEVRRGRLDELVEWARTGVRGEVTLVVGGAEPASAAHPDTSAVTALVAEAQRSGRSRRDAVAAVAAETGLPRRVVYAAAHGEPRPRKPDGPPAAQP